MVNLELVQKVKKAAYLEGDFVTRAGKKTNYYIDKYLFETDPVILEAIVDELVKTLTSVADFDRIAAPAFGAVPIATLLAKKMMKPIAIIKHQPEGDPLVLGEFVNDETVIVIEDILTSGKTAVETCDYLTSIGIKIRTVLSVVNRQEGGPEALQAIGVSSTNLINRDDFLC